MHMQCTHKCPKQNIRAQTLVSALSLLVLLADSAQLSGWATGKLALASLGGSQKHCTQTYACIHTHTYVRILSRNIHTHTYAHTHLRTPPPKHNHTHTHPNIHMHTQLLTHTHPGTYTEIRTCTSNARTYFQSRTPEHRRLSQPSAY
jgi:hypothetical protein